MATVRHPTLGLIRTVEDPAAWIEQGWLSVNDPAPDPEPAPADEPVTHAAQPAPWWRRNPPSRTENP
jgi:hypothetical protein